jgi:hypothetical protein
MSDEHDWLRRRRSRGWAALYVGLFGTGEQDEGDDGAEADGIADGEGDSGGRDGGPGTGR